MFNPYILYGILWTTQVRKILAVEELPAVDKVPRTGRLVKVDEADRTARYLHPE